MGLRLGGPVAYGAQAVEYPWIGEGSPEAGPDHIILAVRLMWRSIIIFTFFEIAAIGIVTMNMPGM